MAQRLTALVAAGHHGAGRLKRNAAEAAPAKIPRRRIGHLRDEDQGHGVLVHAHHDQPRQRPTSSSASRPAIVVSVVSTSCRRAPTAVSRVSSPTADDLDIAVIEFNEKLVRPLRTVQGDHQWIRHRPCHSPDRMHASGPYHRQHVRYRLVLQGSRTLQPAVHRRRRLRLPCRRR